MTAKSGRMMMCACGKHNCFKSIGTCNWCRKAAKCPPVPKCECGRGKQRKFAKCHGCRKAESFLNHRKKATAANLTNEQIAERLANLPLELPGFVVKTVNDHEAEIFKDGKSIFLITDDQYAEQKAERLVREQLFPKKSLIPMDD